MLNEKLYVKVKVCWSLVFYVINKYTSNLHVNLTENLYTDKEEKNKQGV